MLANIKQKTKNSAIVRRVKKLSASKKVMLVLAILLIGVGITACLTTLPGVQSWLRTKHRGFLQTGNTVTVPPKLADNRLKLLPSKTPTPTTHETAHTEQTPSGTMIEGVPVCPHDQTKWHGLVERNADGSIRCTYGHEHKDNPRVLDGIFGSVGQYTAGQEISYPWQTHSGAGDENHAKHTVYNWNVIKDVACKPSNAPYGFTNIRGQFHADGIMGAQVRFHSYFLQAQACDPSDPSWNGKITMGGHMDYGQLFLLNSAKQETHYPLATDPTTWTDDRRIHGSDGNMRGDFTWYGSNRLIRNGTEKVTVRIGLRKEDWGAFDTQNTARVLFYNGQFNGSGHEPMHLLGISVPAALDGKDGAQDGRVTFSGFTDKNGNLLSGSCIPLGADCVPIKLENMKVGDYQFRADVNGIAWREYDVKAPNGKSLIQYPN